MTTQTNESRIDNKFALKVGNGLRLEGYNVNDGDYLIIDPDEPFENNAPYAIKLGDVWAVGDIRQHPGNSHYYFKDVLLITKKDIAGKVVLIQPPGHPPGAVV